MTPELESLGPRGCRNWNRRHRLFLAGDQVLAVRFDGFSEEYRRFQLRDIQGFVVRPTARRAWINAVLGTTAGLLLLPVAWPDSPAGVRLGFLLVALAPLVALLINTLAGPTCRTTLQTAVQATDMPTLSRVADFERALARLQPLLLAAQDRPAPGARTAEPETAPAADA